MKPELNSDGTNEDKSESNFDPPRQIDPYDVEFPIKNFEAIINMHRNMSGDPFMARRISGHHYNLFNNVLRCLASSHPFIIPRLFKNPEINSMDLTSVYLFLENSWRCMTLKKSSITSEVSEKQLRFREDLNQRQRLESGHELKQTVESFWPKTLLKAAQNYEDSCNRKLFSDEGTEDIRVFKARSQLILKVLAGGIIHSHWLDLNIAQVRQKMKKIVEIR